MATSKSTPAARAAKAETKLYDVQSNLDHDGEPYVAGDQVELTADQAKPLIDLQVVKLAAATA